MIALWIVAGYDDVWFGGYLVSVWVAGWLYGLGCGCMALLLGKYFV